MSAPTIFLSAATDDLESLRAVLHGAFSRAHFRVFTQKFSLGASPSTLRDFLVDHIQKSDCVVHLAGMAYGSDADAPFPEDPGFQCSWTQFEYYYGHQQGKKVIALVCAPELSSRDFVETGASPDDNARKQRLQSEHRQRVTSGEFTGTPLAGKVKRTLNEQVNSMEGLLQAVAASVATIHGLTGTLNLRFEPKLHQLPPIPQGFVGREADLATLRAQNPGGGTVLTGLRGMGGIGKTALALVLAHELLPRFPDAQLFLDGRGTQANPPNAGDLLAQVIQSFQPTVKLPEEEGALKSIYHDLLNGKKVLILLDNAHDAAQAKPLIPPAGCALIVTSRRTIGLGTNKPFNVGKLPEAEAILLLREFYAEITDADAAALSKLCAGLPLALRLAGAHLNLDACERGGVADVADYLKKLRAGRLGTLDAEAEDAGEITISETLRLSEDQLLPTEREVWRKLGVFTASFDARAAQTIAGAEEAMLDQFVRRSLLEREGTDRYKLHDLAAEYACTQLSDNVLTDLGLAHARHFTVLANEADQLYQTRGKTTDGLALFDRERVQIEAAYTWLVGRDDETAARQMIVLVDATAYTSDLRFHPRLRIAWMKGQLRAARLLKDKLSEATSLGNLGIAFKNLGDTRHAISYYQQSLEINREIGNKYVEGSLLGNLGIAFSILGDQKQAITFFTNQLTLAQEISDRRGEASALGNLGIASKLLGDPRQAIDFQQKSLLIARELGDRRGEGSALGNLGNAHFACGEMLIALNYYQQHLMIAREIGDRRGEGNALGNLGNVNSALGELLQAVKYNDQAIVITREIGDKQSEGSSLWNSSEDFMQMGNRPEAITRAAAALEIFEAIEDPNTAIIREKLEKWRGKS